MNSFLKKVITSNVDENAHRYFVRFGKGQYNRRFLVSLDKGAEKIKIRGSFELANDLVLLVNEVDKSTGFTGSILMKNKVESTQGKKKAGVFLYEISNSGIDKFADAYFYLLDAVRPGIVLKTKKKLPKPGKAEEKIDDKFCSLDLDLKYWPIVKDTFFWDLPECKKAKIEHDLMIKEIEIPKGEKDPVKVRENAVRKGKIVRRITADGKDISKEYELKA